MLAEQPQRPPRLLIDGRSGSGKSELATLIVDLWPEAQLLRLDDLYPGWSGLDAASAAVPRILSTGRWTRWDWEHDRPDATELLDLDRPIVVEGVGALTPESMVLCDLALWVEAPTALRKARALARDGDTYAPHWDAWAALEEAFIARVAPASLADHIVDGRDVSRDATKWRAIAEAGRVSP